LKLKAVAAHGLETPAFVEPKCILHIVSAMVVVPQQLVVRTSAEKRLRVVKRRSPNLVDYVLSVGVLQQVRQVVVIDQIECISVVKIFLKKQEAHLFFRLHLVHELDCDLSDAQDHLIDIPLHETKRRFNFVEKFDQQA
jgi:hypothetical protein